MLGSRERIPAPQRLPNNIIHPTRVREVASGNSCFGRVMMCVSRISGKGAGLGGMNGCALTWVLATVASAGR